MTDGRDGDREGETVPTPHRGRDARRPGTETNRRTVLSAVGLGIGTICVGPEWIAPTREITITGQGTEGRASYRFTVSGALEAAATDDSSDASRWPSQKKVIYRRASPGTKAAFDSGVQSPHP